MSHEYTEPRIETPKAASAFAHYCAMGRDRSFVKLLPLIGKERSYLAQLERWSKLYSWQERVREYDRRVNEEKLRRNEELIFQMNERHAQIALSLQLKMVKLIEKLEKDEQIDSRAASTLLKYATDLERLARGATTEFIEISGRDGGPIETKETGQRTMYIDLSKLSKGQLDRLEELLGNDEEEE